LFRGGDFLLELLLLDALHQLFSLAVFEALRGFGLVCMRVVSHMRDFAARQVGLGCPRQGNCHSVEGTKGIVRFQ
jgi:hypothetical protein